MARARVELREGLSCTAKGITFKKNVAQYITDPVLIQYLKNQSNFHVVELVDQVKVVAPPPASPTLPKPAPKAKPVLEEVKVEEAKEPTPPPPPVVKPEEEPVERKGVLHVESARTDEAQKKEGPEPLERTPVKPIPRTHRTAKGRGSAS